VEDEDTRVNAPQGLCASCVHAQKVESSKGSSFVLCRLSLTDPRFARYPRLPVVTCDGYASVAKARGERCSDCWKVCYSGSLVHRRVQARLSTRMLAFVNRGESRLRAEELQWLCKSQTKSMSSKSAGRRSAG